MSDKKLRSYFGSTSWIMLLGLVFLLPIFMFIASPQPAQAVAQQQTAAACSVNGERTPTGALGSRVARSPPGTEFVG